MDERETRSPREEERRLGNGAFNGLAGTLVFVAYFAAFLFTGDDGIVAAAEASLRNMIPLAILSAAAHKLILRHLVRRSAALQIAGHVALATAFTLLLYWLLMVLIGLGEGESFTQFVVKAFFPTGAFAWQLLQGVTLYALVACLTYLRLRPASAAVVVDRTEYTSSNDQSPSRYFIRKGEDIQPIQVSRIVSIKGADDYAEVATLDACHLVGMTLTEFEKELNGSFIRVHRSHIVNVERIERAEPAGGGRLLLHMENGQMIPASRAGSRLLRSRVI
jgi:two-component system LytT family response regulator